MTVIGKSLHPVLFRQFSALVKAAHPQLVNVQFVNIGRLQTSAVIDNDLLFNILVLYKTVSESATDLEAVAAMDSSRRERARRHNRAVLRNASKGFGGRRVQQAFTK